MGAAWRAASLDGDRLRLRADLDGAWAATLWRAVAAGAVDDHSQRPLPAGGAAHVKVYRRRDKHSLLRRLRAGRAEREGRGYRAFERVGLPVATLLLYGEHRRAGLHEWGVVVTEHAGVPDVAAAWSAERDDDLLSACAQLLAAIHNAGLVHGDPVTRNFLAAHPAPLAFDLASWGRAGRGPRVEDLTRFLGSVIKLSTEPSLARELLRHYAGFATAGAPDPERLMERANRWASRAPRP